MFTGIIEQVGQIRSSTVHNGILRLEIAPAQPWPDVQLGESIACNGCCLTVVAWENDLFTVELSDETLAKTAPRWQAEQEVNLERAMLVSSRLGGHIVSGHVDAVGTITEIVQDPAAYIITVQAPLHLARYLIPKGSITVDGISLTLVDVGGAGGSRPEWPAEQFSLWLIPHTVQVTTLRHWQVGQGVNLEADVLAKYLERLQLLQASERLAVSVSPALTKEPQQ